MNNLIKYFKTTSFIGFWAVFLLFATSNAYSFDSDELGLSLTHFLDSLSYNYKGFDMRIKGISLGELYDDNITFLKENKKDDFITILGCGIGAKYEGKTRTLELNGNISSQTFAKNTEFNNVTEDIILNFKNEFSKQDRINLNNVFTHTDAPLFSSGTFFEDQFGRIGGRFDYFKNRFHIDYSNDIAKQITVIARYDNYIDAFSGVNIPSSFLNKAGTEVDYLFTSSTIFLVSYDFTNRQFEGGNDASINTITAGIRQYITKKFFFDGKTGLDFINSFDDKKLTRPIVSTSLNYQKDTDTLASLSFNKNYDMGPFVEDIFNNWRATTSLTRQLLERLRGSVSIFYGEGEYISSNFNQKLFGTSTTFTYNIYKNLRGDFTYTYSHLESNIATFGYTKNTVFLGVTAQF